MSIALDHFRALPSPDLADALALTFAAPVGKSDSRMERVEYNPLDMF